MAGRSAPTRIMKTTADITACADAGFTMYTVDPGEHVSRDADTAAPGELRAAWDALPWDRLEDSPASMRARLAGRAFDLGGESVQIDEGALVKAAVKYRPRSRPRDGDVPASVGRHGRPPSISRCRWTKPIRRPPPPSTSSWRPNCGGSGYAGPASRRGLWPVRERRRLPRRPRRVRRQHARASGHRPARSGPARDQPALGLGQVQHLRGRRQARPGRDPRDPAGRYLEALRAIAIVAPDLFPVRVLPRAFGRYEEDRATRVSASLPRCWPRPRSVPGGDYAALLEHFHVEQILHVSLRLGADRQARRRPPGVRRCNPIDARGAARCMPVASSITSFATSGLRRPVTLVAQEPPCVTLA